MVTKNEALRIKHISQYCEEIGKDCDNCLFQDCFSKSEIRTAKSILGDWEEKEIYYLEEACRQWCDFIDEAPERKTGIGFYVFYQQIKQQKEEDNNGKYQVWHVYYDKEMVGQFLVPVGTWVGEEYYENFLPEGYDDSKVVLSYSGSVTMV